MVRLPSHHYLQIPSWVDEFKWLAVVGAREFANPAGTQIAENLIYVVLDALETEVGDWNRFGITSGGADGVDSIGERVADDCWYRKLIYPPKNKVWEPEGFKERNEYIGQSCTWMIAIRCETTKTWGTGHAAEYTESLGKHVARYVIHKNPGCQGCSVDKTWKAECAA